jgi:putative FmdB family regulatory protein
MPIREYRCQKCLNKFETLLLSGEDEASLNCPKCGVGDIRRCMSVFVGLVPNGGTKTAATPETAGGAPASTPTEGGGCSSCASGSCANCH